MLSLIVTVEEQRLEKTKVKKYNSFHKYFKNLFYMPGLVVGTKVRI
jgi:hypothetical protein